MPTPWTAETLWPAQGEQIVAASLLARKARLEFELVARVILHQALHYILGSPESSGYPASTIGCRYRWLGGVVGLRPRTGTDAAWYAQQGFRVLAYDNSQGMVDRAKRNHAELIENHALSIHCSDYETFLEWRPETPVDAVASNLAVLSHIDELSSLFETFGQQIAPKGLIVVSVLNPLFWKDMIHGWWWKSAWHSWGTGWLCVRGGEVTTYRHYSATIIKAASPWFILKLRAGVGALLRRHRRASEWSTPKTLTERVEKAQWKTFPVRSLGQYMFLVFERCAPR